ncbi:MAG: hypothetical protein ABL927_13855 [Bdellovibrionales bacterium]
MATIRNIKARNKMKRYMIIFASSLLIASCTQPPSQTEKDYIKNLEEKNKALETELQEIKAKRNLTDSIHEGRQSTHIKKPFFTIGSTEDEVIEVMGDPTSYMVTAPEARKFYYGVSAIYLYQGKVISYDNLDGKLKVRVK